MRKRVIKLLLMKKSKIIPIKNNNNIQKKKINMINPIPKTIFKNFTYNIIKIKSKKKIINLRKVEMNQIMLMILTN